MTATDLCTQQQPPGHICLRRDNHTGPCAPRIASQSAIDALRQHCSCWRESYDVGYHAGLHAGREAARKATP